MPRQLLFKLEIAKYARVHNCWSRREPFWAAVELQNLIYYSPSALVELLIIIS